jgi:ABC-type multidrug transport system fused ATPase/permease subunit
VVDQVIQLFRPVIPAYGRYLTGMLVRQILLVLSGFALVALLRTVSPGSTHPVVFLMAGLVVFDLALIGLDALLNCYFADAISLPLFRTLRISSLTRLLGLPLEWHQSRNTLETVAMLNSGAGKVTGMADVLGRELLPAVIRTAVSLVPLLWFSAWTTPLLLAGLALFLQMTVTENRERHRYREVRHEQYAHDAGVFTETVQNVQAVVQFGQEQRMLRGYGRLQQEIVEQASAEVRLGATRSGRRNLLMSVTRRACQGVWLWHFQKGQLDTATVLYLNFLTEELIGSFWSYASVVERMFDGAEPARVFLDLEAERSQIEAPSDTPLQTMPEQVGIRMRGVDFAYAGAVRPVLHNFDLEVEPGTIVGLVGRSGIGKTTIQSLLQRLYEVQRGSIEVGGVDVRDWNLNQLRGLFASVSQSGAVFFSGLTIADVIRFGRPDACFAEVVDAARTACIHDEILAMPAGYESRAGSGGVTLSRGQAQRLGLAQALVSMSEDRKVLVLDEFTSALDAVTESRVLENLRPKLRGRTVIIIAHRLATVKRLADKIVVIESGGVVEEGTHRELVVRGERYAELVGLQNIA